MSVVIPHKTIKNFAENQGRETIIEAVGDLSGYTVTQNFVLVATYIRPEKSRGGIFLPDSAIEEDVYQGKVGLVLKLGPTAFIDLEDNRFGDIQANLHDWVVYRVGDAWELTVNHVPCRLIRDSNIRLIINDPESIF